MPTSPDPAIPNLGSYPGENSCIWAQEDMHKSKGW